MIYDALERMQVFKDPVGGSIRIEAFWVQMAEDGGESPPVIGALQQKLGRSYASMDAANQAALAFPQFPALALKFESEPFTAIAELLEALREAQALEEAETQAQLALNRPENPPFEGAP